MAGQTAHATHEPDRMPTEDEEVAAERSTEELRTSGEEASVAEHYRDMVRRGVEQEGEGRIE
ncbi:MAG: hypothetical protein ACRDXC_13335 [Acidimicrobiales bacterium]